MSTLKNSNPQSKRKSQAQNRLRPQRRRDRIVVVTPPLVPLHVAPDAKRLATPRVRTLERLLACVRVAVDPQRARPRERLVARRADVAVLALRERRGRRGRDVVVVLPRVGA